MTDGHGHICKWIMHLRDHFARLSHVRALESKESKYVAYELNLIFGLIGPPIIYQPDNGQEVAGNLIIDAIYAINPLATIITGRPRTPRDQGSIEVGNKSVKSVLDSLEEEARQREEVPNWTMLLGSVMMMLAMNGAVKQTDKISDCLEPYE
jgi:hypothetical protein